MEAIGDILKRDTETLHEWLLRHPELAILLSSMDRQIGFQLEFHRGAAQAITIRALAQAIGLYADDGAAMERSIKESLSRLRLIARMRIVSSKTKPYGLYIAATAEEAYEYAERLAKEGIKLLELAHVFRPERDWVQELAGQMELTTKTPRHQE